MRISKLVPLSLALLAVLGLGVLWGKDRAESRLDEEPESPSAEVAADVAPEAAAGSRDEVREPAVQFVESDSLAGEGSARNPADARPQLVSEDGEPVAGALLRWSPLPVRAFDVERWSAPLVDWSALEAASRIALSDASGRFLFERSVAADPSAESVVWILHPEFFGQSVSVPGGTLDSLPATWPAMAEASPVQAFVRDASGRPVGGALVEQVVSTSALTGSQSPRGVEQRRALLYSTTTNSAGLAQLIPTEFTCTVRAIGEHARSSYATVESVTNLTLQPTFSLELNLVETGNPGEVQLERGVEVGIYRDLNASLTWLAGCSVREPGRQPELEIPLPATSETSPGALLVYLLGAPVVTRTASHAWPRPNERVAIELPLERGFTVPVTVLDATTEAPIPGVDVVLEWVNVGSSIPDATAHCRGMTDASGQALIRGLGPGGVRLSATCDGYAALADTYTLEERPLDAADRNGPALGDAQPIEVRMQRAGVVEGRVTHRGEPVPSFTISWWPAGTPRATQVEAFQDELGAFRLDSVLLGGLTLVAAGFDLPTGEAVTVLVGPEGIAELELELPAAVRGRGRVIDGLTGEPLAGARVLTCGCAEGRATTILNEEVTTDAEGRFALALLSPYCASFGVLKQGYGDLWDIRPLPEGDPIEFGDVPIHPIEDLHVELLGAEQPARYRARLTSYGMAMGEAQFDAAGHVVLPGLRRAEYWIHIEGPDGWHREERLPFHNVELARPWTVRFEAGSGRGLEVAVNLPPGAQPEQLYAEARIPSQLGSEQKCHPVVLPAAGSSDALVRFEDLPTSGPLGLFLSLEQPEANWICSERLELATLPERIERQLSADTFTLRLLDSDGHPLSPARADLLHPDGDAAWLLSNQADQDGRIEFPPFNLERVLVNVFTDSGRMWFGVPLELAPDLQKVTLRLPPLGDLELFATDGQDAQSSIKLQLHQDGTFYSLADRYTDGAGRARFAGFGAGEYAVHVVTTGYWPTVTRVSIQEGLGTQEILALPLGDLQLTLRDGEGLPVPGVELELSHLDLDTPVSAWLVQGRVRSSTGSLRSDVTGQLTLEGLASGAYAWTCGASAGQLFVDPRAQTASLLVVAP